MVGWSHFSNQKGLILGLLLAGFGLGAPLFNLVATDIINPDNETETIMAREGSKMNFYFGYGLAQNFPPMLRWLSLIYLVIGVFGIVLMGKANKHAVEPSSWKENILTHLQSRRFLLLVACSLLSGLAAQCGLEAYKVLGYKTFRDNEFMSSIRSTSAICSGSLMLFWAFVVGKFGFKHIYRFLLVIQIVVFCSFYFVDGEKDLFKIWAIFMVICAIAQLAVFPALHGTIYGRELGGLLYCVLFLTYAVSVLSGFFIQLYIVKAVGYLATYLLLGGMTISSLVVTFMFDADAPLKEETKEFLIKDVN